MLTIVYSLKSVAIVAECISDIVTPVNAMIA